MNPVEFVPRLMAWIAEANSAGKVLCGIWIAIAVLTAMAALVWVPALWVLVPVLIAFTIFLFALGLYFSLGPPS